jgi:hypothetical protein
MSKTEALKQAAEMLIESNVIILQKTLKKKNITMTLKFQKLSFPNVRYTSAANGELERDVTLDIESALSLLALALEHM